MLLPAFCQNIVNYSNGGLVHVSKNLNAYRRYFMVDVIEIFRTFRRKVDYAFYYEKAQIMILKLSKFQRIPCVICVLLCVNICVIFHPMEYMSVA